MNYKKHIGDGKTPNRYWVFQYDEKYKREKNNDGNYELIPMDETQETKNSLLGEFKTYKDALQCVDNKAYLPKIIIEDRLSGQVFESMCIVCPCCNKEDYESYNDIGYTKKEMERRGLIFE
jgi:hypothetical protein